MKVLLVTPSMELAGAERVVAQLATHLVEDGHVVVVAGPAGPLDAELAAAVRRLEMRQGGRSPFALLQGVGRTARLVRRMRPDVVHAHNPKVAVMAAAALRASGLRPRPRLVVSFHGCRPEEYGRAARLLRQADAVACVSADLVERLSAAGLPASRLVVVPNGVDAPTPLEPALRARLDAELALGDGPVITAVGRLEPQKAHERLLSAAVIVRERIPGVRLLIVGDGSRRAALEAQSAAILPSGSARFTGLRLDARAIIARSDLLVFSSDWEGLSIAALEALAAGVPVVSTPAEGMRELLGSGAGRVVGGFAPEPLAQGIVELLADPALRAEMGREGRRAVAERYSVAAMVQRYEALYRGA